MQALRTQSGRCVSGQWNRGGGRAEGARGGQRGGSVERYVGGARAVVRNAARPSPATHIC